MQSTEKEYLECPTHHVELVKACDLPLILENNDYLYKYKCPVEGCDFTTRRRVRKKGMWFV